MPTIPITIISGFANTGKTSVLLDLLHKKKPEEKAAVIMNDVAEVVTGTNKVRNAMGSAGELLLELPNGCICCTLKEIFLRAVEEVANSTVDHLYVEGNAAAEPYLIQSFLKECAASEQVDIQNAITVIDANTFVEDFLSTETLRDRGLVAMPHDDRIISEVLTEQIECADTFVVTKCDLVSDADVAFLEAALTALNPKAKITVLGKKKRGACNRKMDSCIFTSQRPFHPLRLHAALQTDAFNSVLRARGIAWIATRPEYKVRWSQMGSICSLESDGPWWNQGASKEEEQFNAQWFESCSSRYQEVEFIGTDIHVQQLRKLLESCLLTEVEMKLGSDLWAHFDDPFEKWEDDMDRSLFVVRQAASFLR